MQGLTGKRILLGIAGGIAAYKSAELCRQLKKAGAEVRVVMTDGAQEFIQPLTLQALSGNPVHTALLDPEAEAGMGHIELAKWPDAIIIAPATANLIARYSLGQANDLLTSILLATVAKVILAPAMNQAMWQNPLTQRNIDTLQETLGPNRLEIWGPQEGEQACGDVGPGRMEEPEQLCAQLIDLFQPSSSALMGKHVVITAGPTREALDPVRYISNHSSGKMGYALAAACERQGANVTLISGPVNLACPKGVTKKAVTSANDMHDAAINAVEQGCDIFIAAAAVADYRAATIHEQKMKKQGDSSALTLTLEQNPDIVATIAKHSKRPYVVGFAAETNDVIGYAEGKLQKKNLDMIIANDVSQAGIGFNSDDNEVYIIQHNKQIKLDKSSKQSIASEIIEHISDAYSSC